MLRSHKKSALITTSIAALLLTACATNSGAKYQPIVDGPKTAAYDQDLYECQRLAEQRKYINGDTKNDAMIGALAGAVIGAISADKSDALEGAVGGAAVGGLIGGGATAYEARNERKHIVMNCMAGRGYRVLG